jgi:hypothetical protein
VKNIKLIVLLSQPLNAHIEKRLNLNLLLTKGFSLEILDLSAFMMPNYPSVDFRLNESQNLTVTKINKKRCLKLFLEKCSRKCVAIDASNQNPWIRYQLNRNGIPIIRYLSGGLPVSHASVDGNSQLTSTLLKRFLIKLKRGEIRGLISGFCKFFHKKYYFFFRKSYLDILILGGDRLRGNESQYIGKNTVIIESHVPDVEDFVRSQDNNVEDLPKKYLVFLDQNIPYHPDLKLLNSRYSEPSTYFSRIGHFFEMLENLGFEVIIALHPRAEGSDDFGNRKCYKYRTASLVANSSGVISHFSNSINFAVLNNKPIIFIADAELLEMNFQIEILSSWLNKPVFRLEKKIDPSFVQSQLALVSDGYKAYEKNFIKCETDSGEPMIDLLTKQVLRLSRNLH